MDLFDGTSPALHEPAPGRHDERLTQWMGMPGRAGAGLERDPRTFRAPRRVCLEQRLDAHLADEPFRWSLARRSRAHSLNVHVLHLLPLLDSGSKAGAVDHEPVSHVAALDACVGIVDLLDRDDFYVRDDSVLAAVVEHFLGLGNPADVGVREAPVAKEEHARIERG